MDRRPPEFEPQDLARLSGPDSGEQFTNGQGPEEGLVSWAQVAPAYQNTLIQMWLSRPWDSLADFCHQNSLNYKSIHEAFARRRIPTSSHVRKIHENELLKRASVRSHTVGATWGRVAELVGDRVFQILLSHDAHTMDELRRIAGHAVALMGESASASKTLASAGMSGIMTNTEVSVRQSSSLIPPDIRSQLVGAVSNIAENAVRSAEREAS